MLAFGEMQGMEVVASRSARSSCERESSTYGISFVQGSGTDQKIVFADSITPVIEEFYQMLYMRAPQGIFRRHVDPVKVISR